MTAQYLRSSLFVYYSAVLIFPLALAKSSSPSSTLTTLPAAVRTGNSSDPCAFTDRNSLIDRVSSDWQGYNVSLLVATCSTVCPLVYGSGNPDISGIGVSLSLLCRMALGLPYNCTCRLSFRSVFRAPSRCFLDLSWRFYIWLSTQNLSSTRHSFAQYFVELLGSVPATGSS
jgi:hypothetical protein